jgi:hypothetical protein
VRGDEIHLPHVSFHRGRSVYVISTFIVGYEPLEVRLKGTSKNSDLRDFVRI